MKNLLLLLIIVVLGSCIKLSKEEKQEIELIANSKILMSKVTANDVKLDYFESKLKSTDTTVTRERIDFYIKESNNLIDSNELFLDSLRKIVVILKARQ